MQIPEAAGLGGFIGFWLVFALGSSQGSFRGQLVPKLSGLF